MKYGEKLQGATRHLTHQVPEAKTAEFANSVDLDEVAHYDTPYLARSLVFECQYDIAKTRHLLKICRRNICRLLLVIAELTPHPVKIEKLKDPLELRNVSE